MKNILIWGIFLLCLGLMYIYPKAMLNPGDLVVGHQKISNDCFACHQAFGGISNEKCIACHQLSKIGSDSLTNELNEKKVLFHEKLASTNCIACHTDHIGLNPEKKLSEFNHELLTDAEKNLCANCHTMPIDKLHKQLSSNCANCHSTEGWKNDVRFNHSMLAEASLDNCLNCHTKPKDTFHEALTEKCKACHSTEKWVPATFDHSKYFVLDENHQTKCSTCHTTSNYKTYTCYGCHEHSESNIRGEHNEEGIYQFANCVACHKSGNEHDGERNGTGENGRGEGSHEENDD